MSGKLYLVGTPIGNLGDFSPRAAETLETVDFIAAEDTRVTMKLLSRMEIRKPLVSYYEHNARESGERILSRILAGESCALVTDAGMPAISDPGEALVGLCTEAGIEVVAVPGPSAVVTALALSGLPSGRFTFEGFLSVTRKVRSEHLLSLKEEKRTMVFYEAPHKLRKTLEDLRDTFGENRPAALCREMTKLHEEVLHMTLGEACAYYRETEPRGEYVLVVEGASQATGHEEPESSTEERALKRAFELVEEGESPRDAIRTAASEFGVNRSRLYGMFQQQRTGPEVP